MQKVYRSDKQMHNEHMLITQEEKAWCQVLLEILKHHGNLMQCFHATVNRVRTRFPKDRCNESGDRFENSVHYVFRFADTAHIERSLLDGNKDHLLNQARSELMKQEHQVGSLNNLSMSFKNKLMLKDRNWKTLITDTLTLDENKFDYKKN